MSEQGRNDPCPCGSGRKFKHCHGGAQAAATPPPALAPELAAALLGQAAALQRAGRLQDAEALYRTVLDSQPQNAQALEGLGVLLLDDNRAEAALTLLGLAVRFAPQRPEAHYNHGCALIKAGRLAQAAQCFERALELRPDLLPAVSNLCNVYKYFGRVDEALSLLRGALAPRAAEDAALHSNLLVSLHLTDDLDHEAMFAEHVRWAELHARRHYPLEAAYPNTPEPDRPLRIGFVSSNFTGMVLGHFLRGVFSTLDRSQYAIYCYPTTAREDAMSAALRTRVVQWRSIATLDDDAAAQSIRADAIDVLVDLSGHVPQNRLLVFARKPAPVQITWLDYFDTTGLGTMDYLITDRRTTPEGSPQRFRERLLFMPETRLCVTPLEGAPDVAPPPALAQGRFTFGSFNRLDKINDGVLAAWAEILRRVPQSRLVVKSAALALAEVRERNRERMAARGIDPARLELRPPSPHERMLHEYGDIDLALDTFPYNGGATTLDALWMGVPVVTFAGGRMIGRQTAAMLGCVGLDEFVAPDARDYVELAVAKAFEGERLREVRAGLRERMRVSALCDVYRYTRGLEDNFRLAWRRWCAEATFKESTHATNEEP
jgi:predicted O-linked N-acetylglucosamine transferase (SPINDLY family)